MAKSRKKRKDYSKTLIFVDSLLLIKIGAFDEQKHQNLCIYSTNMIDVEQALSLYGETRVSKNKNADSVQRQ